MIFLPTVAAFTLAAVFAYRAIERARYLGWRDALGHFAVACVCAALALLGLRLLLDPTAFFWKWFPLPCTPAMGALC